MGIQATLKALSDPIRREILNMLKSGRMSAGDISEKFPVTGASVSRHLSVLKDADLIRDTREGKYIYYELNASVLEEIMLWITDLKGENNMKKLKTFIISIVFMISGFILGVCENTVMAEQNYPLKIWKHTQFYPFFDKTGYYTDYLNQLYYCQNVTKQLSS